MQKFFILKQVKYMKNNIDGVIALEASCSLSRTSSSSHLGQVHDSYFCANDINPFVLTQAS